MNQQERDQRKAEAIRKGQQAALLIEGEAFGSAVKRTRERIHEEWAAAELDDVDAQVTAKHRLHVLDDVVAMLADAYAVGKMFEREGNHEH